MEGTHHQILEAGIYGELIHIAVVLDERYKGPSHCHMSSSWSPYLLALGLALLQ